VSKIVVCGCACDAGRGFFRICKYQLFFHDILRKMPKEHPSYEALNQTAETVKSIASEVNSRIAQSELDSKLVDLGAKLGTVRVNRGVCCMLWFRGLWPCLHMWNDG